MTDSTILGILIFFILQFITFKFNLTRKHANKKLLSKIYPLLYVDKTILITSNNCLYNWSWKST